MPREENLEFELGFFESLHRRLPKDSTIVSILAHLYTETGRIDAGLKMDRKLVRLTPDNPVAHYNLACSLCLKERFGDAVKVLRDAVTMGYEDFDWMCNDPDLAELQDFPAYRAFLAELGIG